MRRLFLLPLLLALPASAQTFHLDGIDASEMQRIDQALSITAGINKSLGASDVLNLPIIQLQQKIQSQVQAQAKAAEDAKAKETPKVPEK